jgi:hypothetical protein
VILFSLARETARSIGELLGPFVELALAEN